MNFGTALPGSFKLLGMPIRQGREFTLQDDEHGQRVAIVNESLARTLFKGKDPIGQNIKFTDDPDSVGWRAVVGVSADIAQSVDNSDDPVRGVFVPELQEPVQTLSVLVRADGDGSHGAEALRMVVRELDATVALQDTRTLREEMRFALWVRRLFASLIGVFAAMALVIAAVGLYGVMAYSVAQRTQEIGIRMALGAEAANVHRLVVGQALRLTLLGIGIGLAAAFGLTHFMVAVIPGVSPTDPPTFTIVSVLLALSGLVAAWVPAVRATRIDPMTALRCD